MKHFHSLGLLAWLALTLTVAVPLQADEQRTHAPGRQPAGANAKEAQKLDLNTATLEALAAVPVIGPDVARTIIAARPFDSIDELDRVQGISAERLEQIRAQVTVAPPRRATRDSLGLPLEPVPSPSRTDKVDINTADVKTLQAVPSIGPDLARAIITARPFSTVDDLLQINGITAERLEQIRADVTVTGSTAKKQRGDGNAGSTKSR